MKNQIYQQILDGVNGQGLKSEDFISCLRKNYDDYMEALKNSFLHLRAEPIIITQAKMSPVLGSYNQVCSSMDNVIYIVSPRCTVFRVHYQIIHRKNIKANEVQENHLNIIFNVKQMIKDSFFNDTQAKGFLHWLFVRREQNVIRDENLMNATKMILQLEQFCTQIYSGVPKDFLQYVGLNELIGSKYEMYIGEPNIDYSSVKMNMMACCVYNMQEGVQPLTRKNGQSLLSILQIPFSLNNEKQR